MRVCFDTFVALLALAAEQAEIEILSPHPFTAEQCFDGQKNTEKNNKTRLPKRVVSAVLMTDRVQRSKQTEGNTDLGKFDR